MSSTVLHNTFSIARTYDAPVERVFGAFEDPQIKRQWFAEGEGWNVDEFTADFRVDGRERSRFRYRNGPEVTNVTIYQDIVPDQRIVVAHTMTVAGQRISSSLATMEFAAVGAGTKFLYTEQGAYFDGTNTPEDREAGCRELFAQLDTLLRTGKLLARR